VELAQTASSLDAFSQAALALSLHTLGETKLASWTLDMLLKKVQTTADGQLFWETANEDGHYHQKTMASTTRSTALVLRALVAMRPNDARIAPTVHWLMAQRKAQGWGSTNETSFAILALADHALAVQQTSVPNAYAITLNGQSVATGTLSANTPAVQVTLPMSELREGDNALRLTNSGGLPLFYTVNAQAQVAEASIGAAGRISITRSYALAKGNTPITSTFQTGDLVRVTLTVKLPTTGAYMLIEDHLPAGLEALNESLNTTGHEYVAYGETRIAWRDLGYNYKEVRADRVSFFVTEMDAGQRTFTFLARAARSGQFVALPAEAYAMYEPALWGRSASSAMEITPR
jgi:hypothetical protein